MSVVQFHCPLCTGLFQVDDALAGIEVNCPHCQGLITVPGFDAPVPPPPPPPTPQAEALELGCPVCTGVFQVTPDMAGQQVACPHCHQLVSIPEFGTPSEAPPLPPDVGANWLPPSMPPGWSPAVPTPPTFSGLPAAPESTGFPPGFEIPRGRAVSEPSQPAPMLPPGAGPMLPPTTAAPAAPPSNWPSKSPSPTTPQPIERKETKPVPRDVAPGPTSEAPAPKKRDDAFPPSKPAKPAESRKPAEKPAERVQPASAAVEDLLPPAAAPGAAFSAPTADSLLPSAANAEAPIERKPLPMVVPEKSEAVLIPLETGGYMAVREPVKTVRHRGEEIELRKLTPEEKAQRKLVRNLFLFVFSIVILLGVMAAFSWKQIFK